MLLAERETARILVFLLLFLLLLAAMAFRKSGGPFDQARARMVERDIKGRGISDPAVLRAMSVVPRHLFVHERYRSQAYADHPLPIGEGQTISQPYMVAYMTEALGLKPADRVLEIGTGSGYQAAVLAVIVKEVYTIEILRPLAEQAQKRLANLGYGNVLVKHGDGYRGWKEHAPFDAVMITAAAEHIPQPLVDQLKEGGRLVMPLGGRVFSQDLIVGIKKDGKLDIREIAPVSFVPMTGEVQEKR